MRPFLKWAGNKHSIVKHIEAVLESLPEGNRLIEPFVGSGALFLNTRYSEYLLSDINPDLIRLYRTLQSEGPDFIRYCRTFFDEAHNTAERYYHMRETFNTTTDAWLKSALFLYLNRHCFNGLCRYNGRNAFNVPFGRYKKPYFPEKEMLAFYEKSRGAVFRMEDFETAMNAAQPGDVIYCDPPYVPLSETANFTQYSTGGFNLIQQKKLAILAKKSARRGVIVLISNHDTPFTRKIYRTARITPLEVQRSISCDGANRKRASELLALFAPIPVASEAKRKKA